MPAKENIIPKTKKEVKKKTVKAVKPDKTEKAAAPAVHKYIFALGRRKTALVKVKFFQEGTGEIKVNNSEFENYFPTAALQKTVKQGLALLGLEKKVNVSASAIGGGISAQAQAANLAISRALIIANPDSRSVLKKQGYLSRDARAKERKKPGLKRARRAPQWQKR